MPQHKLNGEPVQPAAVNCLLDRLVMFEKYIYIGHSSAMNEYFAFFCPTGDMNTSFIGMEQADKIAAGRTEEDALRNLITTVVE